MECSGTISAAGVANVHFEGIEQVTGATAAGGSSVPEPSTLTLLGFGAVELLVYRRRRRRAA